jgi:fermentation-respiration switch protein FrsA (DUF1100 family)
MKRYLLSLVFFSSCTEVALERVEVEELGTRPFQVGDKALTIHLLKLPREDGHFTYAQWIPAPEATSGAVLSTEPYVGIDWSGDPIDTKWATLNPAPNGLFPDLEGPGGDAHLIVYDQKTPEESANDALIHLLNGLSVLQVYGRFYAGDSPEGEVLDMRAGLNFLSTQSNIDPSRIGVFGGSWGGMESIFAASQRPDDISIRAAVAMFPITDLPDWYEYVSTELPAIWPLDPTALLFTEPYIGRLLRGDSWDPGVSSMTHSQICGAISGDTEVFIAQDDWDTLIPVRQSEELAALCPDKVQALFWRRPEPIDFNAAPLTHGPLLEEPVVPSVFTFTAAFLHSRLLPDAPFWLEIANRDALRQLFALLHDAQLRGEDTASAAIRLQELVDPRMFFFEQPSNETVSGAALLAPLINEEWGTSFTEQDIAAALADGLPQP